MLDESMNRWLADLLARHGAVAGTVHLLRGEFLEIAAAVNIPPKVQEITARIPKGKGMAGIAWERDAPVQTCNLQEDTSGNVRPGAKAVDARAAVAIPVHGDGGQLRGVVGLAWMDDRVLADEAVAAMATEAAKLPY
jgi:hypothetical protein